MIKNIFLVFILTFIDVTIFAQEEQNTFLEGAPKIYIDCYSCDMNYIREKIGFVNYVRDRNVADIHILFSEQRTGGGGREYTLDFIGQGKFKDVNQTLTVIREKTDSDDMFRKKIVKALKLGLVIYVAKTPIADNLSIIYAHPEETITKTSDKWNNWVYDISMNSYLNGEKSYSHFNTWGSISANRVTKELKINISFWGSYNEDNYDWDEKIKVVKRSQSFYASIIKSINNHWSIGLWTDIYSSTYRNINYSLSLNPGIEFNYFPYSESTRKQLRFQYKPIPVYKNYSEETIYFKTNEMLFREKFVVVLELVQTWGSNTTTLSGSHYFHDFNKNSLEIFNNLSINIVTGLTFDIMGSVSMIHDQLSLPLSEIDIEDVYLHQKELETDYNYWCSLGLSYSFGSIYNNIVNPRFGN